MIILRHGPMCIVPHGFWLPPEIDMSPEITNFLAGRSKCNIATNFFLDDDAPAKIIDILEWFKRARIDPWVSTGFVLGILDDIADGESSFYLSRLYDTLVFVKNKWGRKKSLKLSWRENATAEWAVDELAHDDFFKGQILIVTGSL